MKIQYKPGNITRGAIETVKQTISQEKIASAVLMLRDKIYTDKLKAAVQETICNAVDEHKKHKVEKPVVAVICGGELCIRDFAAGLDKDGVLHTFFQFFSSTKDTTNDSIGGFGIGAKAPGAYADIWTVESWHGGKHSVYTSVTEAQESTASLVFVEDCPEDETGIMVRIPIADGDCGDTLDCVRSVASMVGYNDENAPVQVYKAHAYSTLDDIFEKSSCKRIQDILDIAEDTHDFAQITQVSVPRLKHLLPKWGKEGKAFIIPQGELHRYVPYKFWKYSDILFYDGDSLYKGSKSLLEAAHDTCKELGLNSDTYPGNLFACLDRITTIVMFDRGTVNVAPSRENVEDGVAAVNIAKSQTLAALQCILDEAKEKLKADFFREAELIDKYRQRFYTDRNDVHMAMRIKLLQAHRFNPDLVLKVDKAKTKSGFRLHPIKHNNRMSLLDLEEQSCFVDARGLEEDDVKRNLRRWVVERGGMYSFKKKFYVFLNECSAEEAKQCATFDEVSILRERDSWFTTKDMGLDSKTKYKASALDAPRRETPVALTYYRVFNKDEGKVPESEYASTLLCSTSDTWSADCFNDQKFYKYFGFTGMVTTPAPRHEKLQRLGLTFYKNLKKPITSEEMLAELDKLVRYLKSNNVIVSDLVGLRSTIDTPFTVVSSSWGHNWFPFKISSFMRELSDKVSDAMQKEAAKLAPVDVLIMEQITDYRCTHRNGLFTNATVQAAIGAVKKKYIKLVQKLVKAIKYDQILKQAYDLHAAPLIECIEAVKQHQQNTQQKVS